MMKQPLVSTARVVGVTALTFFLYLAFGVMASFAYIRIGGEVYDHATGEGLTALKVLFYACYGVQLVATLVSALVVTRRYNVSPRVVVPVIATVLLLLAYPTLGMASFMSECELNASVPFGGSRC